MSPCDLSSMSVLLGGTFQQHSVSVHSCNITRSYDQLSATRRCIWNNNNNNHRFTTTVSLHLQLITGEFCWCNVLRMPLLKANSAFGLGRRCWSSPQQCYLRSLCTSPAWRKCRYYHTTSCCIWNHAIFAMVTWSYLQNKTKNWVTGYCRTKIYQLFQKSV